MQLKISQFEIVTEVLISERTTSGTPFIRILGAATYYFTAPFQGIKKLVSAENMQIFH